MKTKHGIMLMIGMAISSTAVAKEASRSHLKCYLQIADSSLIVHHFVNEGQQEKQFVASLSERTVFMADGVTEQKIMSVYECVDVNNNFKNQKAIKIEKNTPF